MQKSLFLLVMVVLVAACGSPKKEKEKHAEVKTAINEDHPGKLSYKKHCMACHQRDAGGVPGMYPPLADNKVVSGKKEPLISVMLDGLSGEIEVDGETYNGIMASYKNLSDKEISDILNYLRSNFDNSGQKISESDIKALR